MKQENVVAWEELRDVDDETIWMFVSGECARLGEFLQGFALTWVETESFYFLALSSRSVHSVLKNTPPGPFGKSIPLASIRKDFACYGSELDEIRRAGQAFYYSWRKFIPNLKRDLGKAIQ